MSVQIKGVGTIGGIDEGLNIIGVCTATSFSGTASGNATISNNADNRVITGGSGNALNAESSLTYDGTKVLNIPSSAGGFFQGTDSGGGIGLLEMGNGDVAIQADTGNSINGSKIHFFLDGSEKVRIDSSGRLLVGSTSTNQNISKIVVKASSPSDAYDNHLYLEGNETSGAADTGGVLGFGGHDGGSSFRNWANILGMKENASSGNTASYMAFHTRANGGNPTEKLRITSNGKITI